MNARNPFRIWLRVLRALPTAFLDALAREYARQLLRERIDAIPHPRDISVE